MNKGIIWILVILVVIFGGYALFNGNSTSNPATGEPYRVGVIMSLTGDAAVYGEPGGNIFRMATSEINAAGGIDGRPIELVIEDGKCNGRDAANAMQKLANVDGVEVVIGGFCSSETLAAVPVAEAAGVALFSPGSSNPGLTNSSPFFARNYPSDSTQGNVLADIAYTNKEWRTVGFITEQLDYPLGIAGAFSDRFEELGGTIISEGFITETTDFRTPLAKLQSEEVDALFVSTQTPAAGERIFKQIRELDWNPTLLVADIIPGSPETLTNYADVLEGALAAEFGIDESNEIFQRMLASYDEEYGIELTFQSYAQTEYDSVYMVRDAISEVGYDGEKISQWLRSVDNWQGASGAITIGEDGDRVSGHQPRVIMGGEVLPFEG